MGLESFFGILPPRLFYSSERLEPESLPIPPKVTMVWRGARKDALSVRVGASVLTGENMAKGSSVFVSLATGGVEAVEEAKDYDGVPVVSVSVAAMAKDRIHPDFSPIENPLEMDGPDLLGALLRAGTPGLSLAAAYEVRTVILSAVDPDPDGLAPLQAFAECEDLALVCEVFRKALGASRVLVAVPAGLAGGVASVPGVEVVDVPLRYPSAIPALLAQRAGGVLLEERSGGVVGETFVIGFDVAVEAVGALRAGKPLLEKIVTAVLPRGQRRNFRLRIGSPLSRLFEQSGTEIPAGSKLIDGGALRGVAVYSGEQPVRPQTSCVVLQDPEDVHFYSTANCMACGKCNEVCPAGLDVSMMARMAQYGLFDSAERLRPEDCLECGLCAYVCPAHRPLLQLIQRVKMALRERTLAGASLS